MLLNISAVFIGIFQTFTNDYIKIKEGEKRMEKNEDKVMSKAKGFLALVLFTVIYFFNISDISTFVLADFCDAVSRRNY